MNTLRNRLFLILAVFGSSLVSAQVITSRALPALPEPSWTFVDGSNSYFVGKQTGSVIVVRSDSTDTDVNPPVPPPIPPDDQKVVSAKWFSVIVDPASAEQASWRTAPELRAELKRIGISYRSYLATEQDIDSLGFRRLIQETGLPLVIVQDKEGKVLKATSPKSLTEVQIIAESIK